MAVVDVSKFVLYNCSPFFPWEKHRQQILQLSYYFRFDAFPMTSRTTFVAVQSDAIPKNGNPASGNSTGPIFGEPDGFQKFTVPPMVGGETKTKNLDLPANTARGWKFGNCDTGNFRHDSTATGNVHVSRIVMSFSEMFIWAVHVGYRRA